MKKLPAAAVKSFPISIFDLKQTFKTLPTEYCKVWSVSVTRFIYISVKRLTKSSRLLKCWDIYVWRRQGDRKIMSKGSACQTISEKILCKK